MDLKSQICTALMRVGTRMATVFDQDMAEFGLTQAQFRLLLSVACNPQVAPSGLAELLMLDRATISLVSGRLVKNGYLERREGVNRRTHELALTEAGEILLEAAIPSAVQLAETTLPDWSEQDLEQFLGLLTRLERTIR